DDSKTLLTCGEDKAIRFWEVPSCKQVREVTGYPSIAGVIAPSPDGLLATVGMTETTSGGGAWPRESCVRLGDVAAAREVRQLTVAGKKTPPGVPDVAFAPDGKTLATSGPDARVRFWDVATGKEWRGLAVGGLPGALAFSPRGDTLAVAVGDM